MPHVLAAHGLAMPDNGDEEEPAAVVHEDLVNVVLDALESALAG
jgi:hypothetical protein